MRARSRELLTCCSERLFPGCRCLRFAYGEVGARPKSELRRRRSSEESPHGTLYLHASEKIVQDKIARISKQNGGKVQNLNLGQLLRVGFIPQGRARLGPETQICLEIIQISQCVKQVLSALCKPGDGLHLIKTNKIIFIIL